MKRTLVITTMVVLALAVGTVAAQAAPNVPGK
jgi:hypothetical protein